MTYTRIIMLMLCLAVICVVNESHGQSIWPNEPAGATVLSDVDWSTCPSGSWQQGTAPCNWAVVSDPSAPVSPTGVIESKLEMNSPSLGVDPFFHFPTKRVLYIGHKWKISDPFYSPASHCLNKLFFAWTEMQHIGQFVFYLVCPDYATSPYGPHQFIVQLEMPSQNNCHLENGWGDCPGSYNLYPNKSNGYLVPGQWHTLEVCMEANIQEGDQTGVLKWWLDGNIVGDYKNVNTTWIGWDEVNITPAWHAEGFLPWTQPTPSYHRTDHTRVSTAASCAGGIPPPPPPPPPNPIIGLGASGASFTCDGVPCWLLGASYYDALGYKLTDFDSLQLFRFNAIRIFADGKEFETRNGTGPRGFLNADGSLRNSATLLQLVRDAKARGIYVDVAILNSAYDGGGYTEVTDAPSRLAAVTNVATLLKDEPNVMLEIMNEWDSCWGAAPCVDGNNISVSEMTTLKNAAKAAAPNRLVYTSSGEYQDNGVFNDAAMTRDLDIGFDLLAPHLYRSADWANMTDERINYLKNYQSGRGQTVPIHLHEEQRRRWNGAMPLAQEFIQAAVEAWNHGSASWFMHTDGAFDLSGTKTLFGTIDSEEATAFATIGRRIFGMIPVSSAPVSGLPVIMQGTTLPESGQATVSITKPAGVSTANLVMRAFDANNQVEGEVQVGTCSQNLVPLAQDGSDATDVTLQLTMPESCWVNGNNTVTFRHLQTQGYQITGLRVGFDIPSSDIPPPPPPPPPAITVQDLSPPSLSMVVGQIATLTLRVSSAPTANLSVPLLYSPSSILTGPTMVVIPAGQTQASFNVTAVLDGVVSLSASLNGSTRASTAVVSKPSGSAASSLKIQTLSATSLTIPVGGSATLTVVLNAVAGEDTRVICSVCNRNSIDAPRFLVVPAGKDRVSFQVTGLEEGISLVTVSLNNTSKSAAITVSGVLPTGPASVSSVATTPQGATVTITGDPTHLAFTYTGQTTPIPISNYVAGTLLYNHAFAWPAGTTQACYQARGTNAAWSAFNCQPVTLPTNNPLSVTDFEGTTWTLTGSAPGPYVLNRNGVAWSDTLGYQLRLSDDGKLEMQGVDLAWYQWGGFAVGWILLP